MKYRIAEHGGLFYPQRKQWGLWWENFPDSYCSYEINLTYTRLQDAKAFLYLVENGLRNEDGSVKESVLKTTIHKYP